MKVENVILIAISVLAVSFSWWTWHKIGWEDCYKSRAPTLILRTEDERQTELYGTLQKINIDLTEEQKADFEQLIKNNPGRKKPIGY